MGPPPDTKDALLRALSVRVQQPLVIDGTERFSGQVVRVDLSFSIFDLGLEAKADAVLALGFEPSSCRTMTGTLSSISPVNRIPPIVRVQVELPAWLIAVATVAGLVAVAGIVVIGAAIPGLGTAAAAATAASLANAGVILFGTGSLTAAAFLLAGDVVVSVARSLFRQGLNSSFSDLSNLAIPLPTELSQILGSAAIDRIDFDDLDVHLSFPDGRYDTYWSRGEDAIAPGTAFDLDSGEEQRVTASGMLSPNADLTWAIDGLPILRSANLADVVELGRISESSVGFDQIRRVRFGRGGEVDGGRIPQFATAPPTHGPPDAVPLLLAVRTNEQRYARCAVWRDASAQLHLRYAVFETHTATAWIVRSFTITERRLVAEGRGDGFTGDWREYAVGRRLTFSPGTRFLQAPLRVEWFWNDVRLSGRGSLADGVRFEESDLTLIVTSTPGTPIRGVLTMRVVDSTNQDVQQRLALGLDGTEREVSRSGLEARLIAIQEQVATLLSPPFRLPLTPQPDPGPYRINVGTAAAARAEERAIVALDPSRNRRGRT